MTRVPAGLEVILEHAPLPPAALLSAAEQPPLVATLARRRQLPDAVIRRCFVPGAPPRAATAQLLVDRKLSAGTIRHVLRDVEERRPEVVAALINRNVPARPDRLTLMACAEPGVDEAILANDRWPIDEQLDVVHRVGGAAALRWLAFLDPSVSVTWDDLGSLGRPPDRLDARPVTALHALLRRPWLSEIPFDRAGTGLRSAIATVTADERTLFRLLGAAQRLAEFGRRSEAAGIIEAVACNPAASVTAQRRCRQLARRIRCPYLIDWLPAHGTQMPLWQLDHDGQRVALERIEELQAVRHRTVWSAGLLAANPRLASDVRARVIGYLDRNLAAVDAGGRSVDVLADRLEVDAATRQGWHDRCRAPQDDSGRRPHPARDDGPGGEQPSWAELVLDDCLDPATAARAARQFTRAFGHDRDAWTIALLLLRDGWDAPLMDLAPVVGTLAPAKEFAA